MSEIPSRKMTRGVIVLALPTESTSLRMPVSASILRVTGMFLAPNEASAFLVSPQQSACRVGRSYATDHDSVTRAEMREDPEIAGKVLTGVTLWWAGYGGSHASSPLDVHGDLFTVRPV